MQVRVPWFVWTSLASVTCILFGVYWDISWHMTIGRDSFWTPAHIAIQLGGVIAAGSGTYLILATTLRPDAPLRAASISVWAGIRWRGPFGAFLAVWGGATMIVSAPFDNWWHTAYGLDVKILSPPHVVLQLGILGVAIGGVLLVLATLNRATGPARRSLEWIILLVGGAVLTLGMISILERTFRANLHRADAYRAMAIVVPLMMLTIGHASGRRWAATILTGSYTAFMAVMIWVFPLFSAEPKLGPVYQPITHMIPLEFPMLIVVPAIAIDLLAPRLAAWPRWRRAMVFGVVFATLMVAVQWPFAAFLTSEASQNRFFGTHYLPYFMQPGWYEVRGEFMPDPDLTVGLVQSGVIAVVGAFAGLVLGDALRRVRR